MATFSDEDFKEIPLEYLTTPRDGAIVGLNTWWIARNGNPVVYIRNGLYSRQRNKNKAVLDHVIDNFPPGYEVIHLPVYFDDHSCGDYV